MKLRRQWQHGSAELSLEDAVRSHLEHTFNDSGQLEDIKERINSLQTMLITLICRGNLSRDIILDLLPGWEEVK